VGFIPICGISLFALSLAVSVPFSFSTLSLALQNLQLPAYPFLARYTHTHRLRYIYIYICICVYTCTCVVCVCASVLYCVSFELKMENWFFRLLIYTHNRTVCARVCVWARVSVFSTKPEKKAWCVFLGFSLPPSPLVANDAQQC